MKDIEELGFNSPLTNVNECWQFDIKPKPSDDSQASMAPSSVNWLQDNNPLLADLPLDEIDPYRWVSRVLELSSMRLCWREQHCFVQHHDQFVLLKHGDILSIGGCHVHVRHLSMGKDRLSQVVISSNVDSSPLRKKPDSLSVVSDNPLSFTHAHDSADDAVVSVSSDLLGAPISATQSIPKGPSISAKPTPFTGCSTINHGSILQGLSAFSPPTYVDQSLVHVKDYLSEDGKHNRSLLTGFPVDAMALTDVRGDERDMHLGFSESPLDEVENNFYKQLSSVPIDNKLTENQINRSGGSSLLHRIKQKWVQSRNEYV